MNTMGERIASLRKKKGMTQEELANIIGISAQSVSKWENNTNMPDIMLIPVLADIFGVTTDTLFGKSTATVAAQLDPEHAFDAACQNMTNVIFSSGQNCFDNNPERAEENYRVYIEKLKKYKKTRSAIIRPHGVLYYREELGGLMIRRPEEGWKSLLKNHHARQLLTLLADEDFCNALHTVITTNMTTFTLSSLCNLCNPKDAVPLEEKLKQSNLFKAKKIDLDAQKITVYELVHAHRLFLLFAILAYAGEYAKFEDHFHFFFGDASYYTT